MMDESNSVPSFDGEFDCSIDLNFHSMNERPLCGNKYQVNIFVLIRHVSELNICSGYFDTARDSIVLTTRTAYEEIVGWAYAPEQSEYERIANLLEQD
jgi:hypothetical protein